MNSRTVLHAAAPGCAPIEDAVELETPGWWG